MTSKSVSLQEAMEQENRRLRAKLEKLEKEHRELKRAYFELSLRWFYEIPFSNPHPFKSSADGIFYYAI
jgi:hypothetical protein